MKLPEGTLLQGGKYRIEEKIGQGGFGITYKACQPLMLGRKVCIKEFCLKQHFSRESTSSAVTYPNDTARKDAEVYQQKFIKEAQTLYSMHHPNIMEIYDIFEENNTAYYVMEYIEGESLKDMLERRGCIPETEALGYIRKVVEALKYIHSRDINHFDVKPANILVRSSDNEIILIDFGTSKHYDSKTGNATTMTAGLLSPGYAPIEQYQQGGVSIFTPETDIYALGATLYKLLTGNTPPEPTEIISNGIPELPSSVSKATKDLIKWTMQLNKKDRPHSCDEFLNALPSNVEENLTGHTSRKKDDDATISIDSEETTCIKKSSGNNDVALSFYGNNEQKRTIQQIESIKDKTSSLIKLLSYLHLKFVDFFVFFTKYHLCLSTLWILNLIIRFYTIGYHRGFDYFNNPFGTLWLIYFCTGIYGLYKITQLKRKGLFFAFVGSLLSAFPGIEEGVVLISGDGWVIFEDCAASIILVLLLFVSMAIKKNGVSYYDCLKAKK